MNKYFVFIIMVILLISCCVLVNAENFPQTFTDTNPQIKAADPIEVEIKLDFQYSSMRAKTNNKTLFCGLEGRFKKDSQSPIEFVFENKLTYAKSDDDLDTDRQLLNYQLNYDIENGYVFFNMQSLRDTAMSIDGELSHGMGIGGRAGYISGQIGLFSENQTDDMLSRGRIKAEFPLSKQINLILDDTGELNLSAKDNYRLASETALNVNLTQNLALRIGYNIIYIEDANDETLDTTKRYYTGLTYTL